MLNNFNPFEGYKFMQAEIGYNWIYVKQPNREWYSQNCYSNFLSPYCSYCFHFAYNSILRIKKNTLVSGTNHNHVLVALSWETAEIINSYGFQENLLTKAFWASSSTTFNERLFDRFDKLLLTGFSRHS